MPLTIGMVAAPIVGGLIGNARAGDAQNAANNARMQALAQYAGISVPELQDQMVNYEKYQSQGQLNPLLEQVISQQDTGLNNIQIDPRLKASQMSALESIAGMASGNPQAGDLAGFELARRNVAGENQAKQNQILQDMQQRGQGGSGAELLAKLKGNQSSSDELAKMQMQQAQTMQQAKMAAIQEKANLASTIRSQDYGQAAAAASAQDIINAQNRMNSQNVANQNVGAQNNAQQFNLTNAQQLANNNVNVGNAQQDKNKGLIQQKFNNQLNLAAGKSGQYNNQAAADTQNAANQGSMWASIGQGAGTIAGNLANAQATQNLANAKKTTPTA